MRENTLAKPLNAAKPPNDDSDECLPVPQSHGAALECGPTKECAPRPPEMETVEGCVPPPESHEQPCEPTHPCEPTEGCGEEKGKKYTAFPAVQSGWTFPAQPNA